MSRIEYQPNGVAETVHPSRRSSRPGTGTMFDDAGVHGRPCANEWISDPHLDAWSNEYGLAAGPT